MSLYYPDVEAFRHKDVARRSLQPRARIHSLDNLDGNLRRTLHIIKERRSSLGGRDERLPPHLQGGRDERLPPQRYPRPSQQRSCRSGSVSPLDDFKPGAFLSNGIHPDKEFGRDAMSWRQAACMYATSTIKADHSNPVLYVRNAWKGYGRGNRRKLVLQNINMTVCKGEIYGLLGASGCGKTTLLSIVVGRRHFDRGVLRVFGGVPGDSVSGIPGPRVGYMPQELALFEEFTVKETADYFGRIYNMTAKQIRLQVERLVSLLDLPPETRKIASFSGGQQRRVSFLISLLADAELLILDEPTVGVDPILRQSIWDHLVYLASQRGKTIIITTHYIEETTRANRIGLLSGGRLLAEDSPDILLKQFQAEKLEDVFLKLCIKDKTERSQEEEKKDVVFANTWTNAAIMCAALDPPKDLYTKTAFKCPITFPSFSNFVALLTKNFLKLRRNPAMLLFIFLLPAIQVVFFCVAIGQEPRNLRLGYVNDESDSCPSYPVSCNFTELGCRYLENLKYKIELTRYDNVSDGDFAVLRGDVWGVLQFKHNFSAAYVSRMSSPIQSNEEVIDESTVEIRLDMSNQQVALTLQGMIMNTFNNFTRTILQACKYPEELASLPLKWGTPVYGDRDPSFTEFMSPGIIILIIYFLAVALTGEAFISERANGLLDRSWIAGVRVSEIIASHIVAQFLVMIIQTAITLVVIIWGFSIPCRGPFVWLAIITVLQGLAGMSFGFLVSALCDSQAVAMQLSIGSFYPNLLLSGILWPLEGMPDALRKISLFLPNTMACSAMRNIMLRGWHIDREEVYLGVVSSSVWIFIFLTLSWIIVRVRK